MVILPRPPASVSPVCPQVFGHWHYYGASLRYTLYLALQNAKFEWLIRSSAKLIASRGALIFSRLARIIILWRLQRAENVIGIRCF